MDTLNYIHPYITNNLNKDQSPIRIIFLIYKIEDASFLNPHNYAHDWITFGKTLKKLLFHPHLNLA